MSWKESDPMSQRVQFIGLLKNGHRTVAGLCREFGISRKTAYKWADRFEQDGLEGLKERSRAPHHQAQETSTEVQELLLQARKKHPTWGPRKLKAWLEDKDEDLALPAVSTIGDLLRREGLVHQRRRRIHPPAAQAPTPGTIQDPNQEWDADFKGEFKLGNGAYCYPLTLTDAYSRYLLGVRALAGTAGATARPFFEQAFRQFGLPCTIRTDNGAPFASTGLGRLSTLSVWWIRLGIRPVRGRPHHPQDNGRHERMHRTLKAETTRPPAVEGRGQQMRFDAFRREYNDERPHEALELRPPARIYRASIKTYPEKLDEVEYPAHYEVRYVSSGGVFGWRSKRVFVGHSLIGEHLGLVEVEDGLWRVYFANVELGLLDEQLLRAQKTGRVLPM